MCVVCVPLCPVSDVNSSRAYDDVPFKSLQRFATIHWQATVVVLGWTNERLRPSFARDYYFRQEGGATWIPSLSIVTSTSFFFFFFSLGYRGEKDPQVLRFTPPTPWLFFRLYSLIITTSFVTAAAGVLSPLKSSFIHFKREARRRSPDNDFREKSFFFFF